MRRSKYLLLAVLFSSPAHAVCDPCLMSEPGVQLIRFYEGFSPFIYKDAGGKPTIGYGHLILPGEKFPQPLLGKAAEDLLLADIRPKERAVNRLVAIPLRQGQFDALTSFAFNVGSGALGTSTLLKRVNAKRHEEATAQFSRWVYVDGKKLRGLERRRNSEAKLYAEDDR